MMRSFWFIRRPSTFIHRESGITLIETVVALVIMGIIAVTFLTGVTTSSKIAYTADERATAESLARGCHML